MSKFQEEQEAFYVNPFTFHIEKVLLVQEYEMQDSNGWIEGTGAYLEEKDLFDNLKEARQYALLGLLAFYNKRVNQIIHNEPEFYKDEENEIGEWGGPFYGNQDGETL